MLVISEITWELLDKHRANYDGTCVYCGGRCKDEFVPRFRRNLEDLIIGSELGFVDPPKNLKQIKRRYAKTLTYSED